MVEKVRAPYDTIYLLAGSNGFPRRQKALWALSLLLPLLKEKKIRCSVSLFFRDASFEM